MRSERSSNFKLALKVLALGSWLLVLLSVFCYLMYGVCGLKEAEIFKLALKVLVLGSWFLALLSVVCYLRYVV
jgi:hypothetical protein